MHLLAGDFNFECKEGNLGFDLFKDVMSHYNLLSCDDKVVNKQIKFKDVMSHYNLLSCDDKVVNKQISHTYVHETLNHHSWLDHFFVNKKFYDFIQNCSIIDRGSNLSDHLPISCELNLTPCN